MFVVTIKLSIIIQYLSLLLMNDHDMFVHVLFIFVLFIKLCIYVNVLIKVYIHNVMLCKYKALS